MRRTRMHGSFAACLAAAWTLCAGCTGSLFESDTPVSINYVLAPAKAAGAGAPTQADLAIGRPSVAPGLDTERIAVLKGRELDYYRAARWGGNTGDVLQSLLVGSLHNQQLFRSVSAEQARVAGNYLLDVEVRDFQAEYAAGGAPTVRVAVIGRLIRVVDRQLVESIPSSAEQPATEDRMSAVAAAFEAASQKISVELAQKTAAAIAADGNKKKE
jgi:cholesterol transport system auxiliary component